MTRLAITGGAGFLGCHLCKILSNQYEEILLLDIAPFEPDEYPSNTTYLKVDVREKDRLEEALKGTDFLIHAAGALPLYREKEIFDTNIKGTRNTLEAARSHRIEKIIHISSTAVYGIPKKHPIEENDPLQGVGAYGQSKIEAEKVCQEYQKKGMCISVVRPKTFIGTGRLGVFQILYDWIKNGKRIPIIGKGRNRYQLLEVEDLVGAIQLLLLAPPEKANSIFNVGAREFGTVSEDLTSLCQFAGTGARVFPTPALPVKLFLALLDQLKISPLYPWVYKTADKDSYVSIEKISRIFGWAPKYSNAQALIKSYDWYGTHCNELSATGITHRTAWDQGALEVLKRFL